MKNILLLLFTIVNVINPVWNRPNTERFVFGKTTVEIVLSTFYHVEMMNEEEGGVLMINFPDLVSVIITNNPLAELEYDSYLPQMALETNAVLYSVGVNEGNSWMRIKYNGTRIYITYKSGYEIKAYLSSVNLINNGETVLSLRYE